MILKHMLFAVLFLLVACGEKEDKAGEILHVAPYTSACIGAGPMDCLRVRSDGEPNF